MDIYYHRSVMYNTETKIKIKNLQYFERGVHDRHVTTVSYKVPVSRDVLYSNQSIKQNTIIHHIFKVRTNQKEITKNQRM
jgi:hypothetical protein